MAKVKFYPIDIDEKVGVRLFGRTEDGKSVVVLDKSQESYFYIIPEKEINLDRFIDNIKDVEMEDNGIYYTIEKVVVVDKKYLGDNVKAIKIIVDKPASIKIIKEELKKLPEVSEELEDDIPFYRKYLIDKDITPLTLCEVDGELREDAGILHIDGKVSQISEKICDNYRMLAFDIETYSTASEEAIGDNPIISLALYGNDGFRKVITWKRFKDANEDIEFVGSEDELIERFKVHIKDYDPDFLVGYYSDGFDFPQIIDRAKKYKISLDLGKDKGNINFAESGKIKSAKIGGIVHLDIYKFISKIMAGSLNLDSYSLGSVSNAILGENKLQMDFVDINQAWDKGDVRGICDYNLQDSRLTLRLAERILPNLIEIAKIVGINIFDVCRVSYGQLVESYLIKRAKEFNVLIPNKPSGDIIAMRRVHTYQGGFVMEPKPGLYENLVVLDFMSLYPSIIVSKNISPSSLNYNKGYKSPDIVDESGRKVNYYFDEKEDFIPSVIRELIVRKQRIKEIIKENKDDNVLMARSYGLKTIANSSYGYYAFFGARWYSKECASSITAFGREFVQDVIKKAEKFGLDVIYADTDGFAARLGNRSKDDVLKFLGKLNKELPGLMELELEDFYKSGIFVSKKGKLGGAKKKYALINENGKMKIIGFETIRRDWSLIARQTQRKVLEIVLKENNKEKALNYVKDVISKLRGKEVKVKDLTIFTQLRMKLEDYVQIGPHVSVAKKMQQKGIKVGRGDTILFVIKAGKGMIRDRADIPKDVNEGDYDEEYYVNNQIIPSVEKIFEVLGYNKEDLIKDMGQSSLGDF